MTGSLGALGRVMLAAACVAAPSIAHAQQEDAFKKGLEARDEKSPNYAAVAQLMRAAIARDPMESPRTTKFGGFLGVNAHEAPYLPHYYLGEALFQQGDCAGALDQWGISDQQGIVRAQAEYVRKMQDGYQACSAKGFLPPVEFRAQSAAARQALTDVNAHLQRVTGMRESRPEVWRPEFNEQLDRATTEFRTGLQRLNAGTRTRSATDFVEARANAERANAIANGLEKLLTDSLADLTAVQRQTREVEQALGQADANDRSIESNKIGLTDTLVSARQSARELLARARDRLRDGQATLTLNTVNEALRYAQDGRDRLADLVPQVAKLARGRFTDAVTAADQALSFMDSSLATVSRLATEKTASATPELTAKFTTLQAQATTLRRRLDRARRGDDAGAVAGITREASAARVELDALIQSFGPATIVDRGVRPALVEGARLFFAGEYQKVLAALDPARPELADAPLQLHIHLFRAAALYAQYVRAGDKGPALRQQALAEVQECKRLEPAFVPDARAFAPRFISFYQNGGAQTAARRDASGTQ